MKTFHYVAKNENGKKVKASINARDRDDALLQLKEENLFVITIRDDVKAKSALMGGPHMNFEERLVFTQHLSTLIQVGIPIAEALEILHSQATRPTVKSMYESLLTMVQSGQTLSRSLAEYPRVFGSVFINMVETGEASGTLVKVLSYLELQMEKEYELRKKVISAFIYPAVIVGITVMLTLGIMIFVMPKILKIFDNFDVQLPLPTRIVMGISGFLTTRPLMAILLVGLVIGGGTFLIKWKKMTPFWHRLVLYIPVFGTLLKNVNLARFARTLNSLIEAGVPIARCLEITEKASSHHLYQRAIHQAVEKVEQGGKLGEAFEGNEKLFPVLTMRMLAIGERSGSLQTSTAHLAKMYERKVDSITNNLTVMLEPILLVFMGAMVGGVAISVILPIYQLPNLIGS